ncbi:MAG: TadE/TadG family type IV pilus assembly protein [Myxococcota bacterium]
MLSGLKNQRGSAIVESAILIVAMVAVVLWSHVLLDIALAKIKTQEVVRYAAWEFSAYQLSDYSKDGGTQSKHNQLVNKAKDAIRKDVEDRYSHSLDSAYNYRNPKKEFKPLSLSQYELTNIMVNNKDVTELQILNMIINIVNMFGGGLFGTSPFNNKGYVEVTASIAIHINETDPRKWQIQSRFMQDSQRGFFHERMYGAFRQKTLREKFYLLVDDWAMYDGRSVYPKMFSSGGGASADNYDYQQQVERISMFGNLGSKIKITDGQLQSLVGMEGFNPLLTRLASVRFRNAPGGSGRNDDSGTVELEVSGGQNVFVTAPYCDNENGANPYSSCTGDYKSIHQKRGNCYMGCPKKQFGGKWLCDYSQAGATDECQNP